MASSVLKFVYRRYISFAMTLSILFHAACILIYLAVSQWWKVGDESRHDTVFTLSNLEFLQDASKPKSSGSQASIRAKVSSDKDLKKISANTKIVADEKQEDKKVTDSSVVDTTARIFGQLGQGNGLGNGVGQGVGDEGGEGNFSGNEKVEVLHTNPRVKMMVQPNVENVKNKINGSVRFRLRIDAGGNVLEAVIIRNSTKDKELEAIAKKAALKMKFYPATDNGIAAEDWFDHEIIFKF